MWTEFHITFLKSFCDILTFDKVKTPNLTLSYLVEPTTSLPVEETSEPGESCGGVLTGKYNRQRISYTCCLILYSFQYKENESIFFLMTQLYVIF